MDSSIVDDLSLVRKIKAEGLRWRVANLADLISCRMHQTLREAFQGFVKNLFAAFDFRLLPFGFAYSLLRVLFWLPQSNQRQIAWVERPVTTDTEVEMVLTRRYHLKKRTLRNGGVL